MDRANTVPQQGATTTSSEPPAFEFLLGDLPAVIEGLERLLRGFEGRRGIREAQRIQEWAAGLETSLTAGLLRSGATERDIRDVAEAGGTRSKQEADRRRRRASTQARNRDLGNARPDPPADPHPAPSPDVSPNGSPSASPGPGSSGAAGGGDHDWDRGGSCGTAGPRLNSGQLDALGWADERTDGAAAVDVYFVELLSRLSAEQALREARRYVKEHRRNEVEERHERQRARRKVYRQTEGDSDRIIIEGDTPSIDEIWAKIEADANRLYHEDGGRSVPFSKHPRTRGQRMFDAAYGMFVDAVGSARQVGWTGKAAATRATLVLTTTVQNATDGFPNPVDLVGSGPISREFLGRILPSADWAGMLFSQDGHPLWLGRSVRNATMPQRLALTVRDQGCVQCGAAASRCEIHHVKPWESRARGETNVDEMCLLCPDCHHQLHHQRQTLEWDAEIQRWLARPALPHEQVSGGS